MTAEAQLNFPSVERIRLMYTASQVTSVEDPVMQTVLNNSAKLYAGAYYKNKDGSIGTVFMVAMPEGWEPPKEELASQDLSKASEQLTSSEDSEPYQAQ